MTADTHSMTALECVNQIFEMMLEVGGKHNVSFIKRYIQ